MAGLEAEKRASKRIEVKDVEAVEDDWKVFLRKGILALNSIERALLKLIYISSDEITTGQLYKQFKEIVQISYAKFHEVLMKLEHLKLIDTAYRKGGRRE